MTKKITPERLRKYADMYDNDSSYDRARIVEEIGIKSKADGGYLYPVSAVLAAIAASIEQYYIELPTDKDGNQLYIGSAVYDKDGNIYYVQGASVGEQNVFLAKFGEGTDCAGLYRSQDFTKERPDSWKRIIKDATWLGIRYSDAIGGDSDVGALIDQTQDEEQQLIARCRKLAGETDE